MTLSLAHATLLHLPPPDFIRTAARAGFDRVGLRLIPIGLAGEPRYEPGRNPTLLREIKQALDETGVRFMDVEVVMIGGIMLPGGCAETFECAAALGARYAIASIYEPDRQRAAEDLAALCDLAARAGITVLVEPVSFSAVTTVSQARTLLRECGRTNTALLVDALHVHSSGESPSAIEGVPPAQLPFVHFCDGPSGVPVDHGDRRQIARGQRLLPGEGGIDLSAIVTRLPPETVFAIEAQNPGRALALGADAYARLAFDTATSWLARNLDRRP